MKIIVVVTQDKAIAHALTEVVTTALADVYPGPAKVLPASSLDDVLDILSKERIDLLMTEHHLADMSGPGLVRWLDTALVGTVKILLTSDARLLAEPWKFLGPEINDVLPRPLERNALNRALQRWLGNPFGRAVQHDTPHTSPS